MPKKRLPVIVGYVLFAIVCLLLNLYWTFPANALAQRLAQEVEKQTNGVWKVTFKDASPYRFTGVELEGVTITKRDNPTVEPVVLQFDALRARLRLLPLLILRTSVSAQVLLGDGVIGAKVTPRKDAVDVVLYADDLNLGQSVMFSKLSGVPLAGIINGTVDAHWANDPHKVETDVDLTINGAALGPGKVANMFSIPATGLGDLALKVEIHEGKVKIAGFKQAGSKVNVHLQMGGGATLNQPLPTSNLDVCLQFKAEDAFLNNNPTMRSALQLAEVQLKKDSDGYLNVPLAGAVTQPQVRFGNLCRR